MKTAAASVINASAFSPPILNRISKTSAFFRRLSLNAEKNWHQNSGAKRREARSDGDIDPSEDQGGILPFGSVLWRRPSADARSWRPRAGLGACPLRDRPGRVR